MNRMIVLVCLALFLGGCSYGGVTQNRPTSDPAAAVSSTEVSANDGMVMVYVPAGEFLMGAAEDGAGWERPQHTVYLDGYWIDRTEVTERQFERFAVHSGYDAGTEWRVATRRPDQPVTSVSWLDAEAYCRWSGRQLPTEAQWEKAARGTDGRKYPWGDEQPTERLLELDPRPYPTMPVGSYPAGASPYGALDMVGSVAEWVADWLSGDYYSNSPRENPQGQAWGASRVVRGGFGSGPQSSTYREGGSPISRDIGVGFRCARP